VTVEAPDQAPIILDLGTGVRALGAQMGAVELHSTVLLTHLHWDHVQGLPFFAPMHNPATTLDVHGPRQAEGDLGEVFAQMMRPPFFPIRPDGLAGTVRFHDTGDDDFPVGLAKVRSRWVRHVGPTLGYRVDWNGIAIAYIPDHGPGCCPDDPDDHVPQEILELCDGVDVLIHDAQHTMAEYGPKRHWGHSTIDYAILVAREAGARKLALFHHDPAHHDEELDRIAVEAAETSAACGSAEVVVAREGLVLDVAAAAHDRT
jgi:phosphoribosyl 1,2-cyclic phosphodiesterase